MQKNNPRITVRVEVVYEQGDVSISEHSSHNLTTEEAGTLMGYALRAVDNYLTPSKIEDVTSAFENAAFQAN